MNDLPVRNLVDYVDGCCEHGTPRKRKCDACEQDRQTAPEGWICRKCGRRAGVWGETTQCVHCGHEPEEIGLHDAGRCHVGDNPCPLCGKSAERTFGGE